MAISKARKDELVTQYIDLLNDSKAIFIADYTGMTVKEVEDLRGVVREADGAFYITKNTLLKVALEQTGRPIPTDLLTGQTATGFALSEAPTIAKVLTDYAKKDEKLVIRGGVMNEDILNADEVIALAKLPSLDQLRGQLIGLISAPAQNLASVVAGGVRQVVNVIDAYAKKDENAAADAA